VNHFDMTLAAVEPRRRTKRRRGHDTIGLHRLPTCSATGKVRYRDHAQASDGLESAKEARIRDERAGKVSRRREPRSYKCPDCGGWHNTSIPQRVELPREEPVITTAKPVSARAAA